MREIKFRAWSRRLSMWIYGELEQYDFVCWREDGVETPDVLLAELEMEPWQEYTGLKDKNGVEIYEGDILEMRPSNPARSFRKIVEMKTEELPNCCCSEWSVTGWMAGEEPIDSQVLVIGNINQHPELLQ